MEPHTYSPCSATHASVPPAVIPSAPFVPQSVGAPRSHPEAATTPWLPVSQ